MPRAAVGLAAVLAFAVSLGSCGGDTEPVTDLPGPPDDCPPERTTPDGCLPAPEPPIGRVEPELPGVGDATLVGPLRLVPTPSGRLLVADSRAGWVFVVNPALLEPIQGIEVEGKPLSVELLGDRIYVGVEAEHTVRFYRATDGSADGSLGAGAVGRPADLAADTIQGLLFVLDGAARVVKVFDPSGVLLRTLGDGELVAPTALGLDPVREEVLVSDYGPGGGPATVHIYGYDGTPAAVIDGTGDCGMVSCTGGFSRPQGAAVDSAGRIYLTDALMAAVLVFDRETLTQTGTLGGRDTGAGLRLPTSVALDSAGTVFVTSHAGGSVERLEGGVQ